jgi:hypothetical protein
VEGRDALRLINPIGTAHALIASSSAATLEGPIETAFYIRQLPATSLIIDGKNRAVPVL